MSDSAPELSSARAQNNLGAEPLELDALDLYHANSKNLLCDKQIRKAYQVHFHPSIALLMAQSAKFYENRTRIRLPESVPESCLQTSIVTCIRQRKSERRFASIPMDLKALGTVLQLANGVRATTVLGTTHYYQRVTPSAGNLCSIEIYVICNNVAGIGPGLYHYDSVSHQLSVLKAGLFSQFLCSRALFQSEFAFAPSLLVLTGATRRVRSKYGVRAYRYIHLDAGHVGQNVYLVCTALGLACCATTGFMDDELEDLLGIDGRDETVVYALAIGHRAEQQ